ncbi:Uncharacterised protein [Corynebacterium imitans]|uniref:Uncharacterized protein n=1 Tax=Corynebacterium imitans TaxID=156978 RepID=A0A076NKM9_9CORY|nr:hypothetical protein [Corynebacterium imitans]AIJ33958.1 hypothetical protein CIMIT_08585 [Corynebacterium imitans]SNV77646.1 Uncharacterised protein [Corynebacterium imitans]
MSAPLFASRTSAELRAERDEVEREMSPYTVAMLRRLRKAGELNFREEALLDRYESLSWLIDG